MDKYNQGFFKFGPMEQCRDGKWVKYEDVDLTLSAYREIHDQDSKLIKRCIKTSARSIGLLIFSGLINVAFVVLLAMSLWNI